MVIGTSTSITKIFPSPTFLSTFNGGRARQATLCGWCRGAKTWHRTYKIKAVNGIGYKERRDEERRKGETRGEKKTRDEERRALKSEYEYR